ncbi:GTP pyrophosphokinase [Acidovorax sp.]|uniref:GTP pyrophosphokinase n=1 Tax=Acidovorax sp. TaxID=1872122 RepID=UPI004037D420
MTDSNFGDWLVSKKPELEAFGRFVTREISSRVFAELSDSRSKTFFKIEPTSRAKDVASAVKKQKIKNYSDPKYQMTDLVGARFVVLLRSDIKIVENCLINCSSLWTARRDREPKSEADTNPDAFRYQSVHYIIRNIEDRIEDGVTIHAETACEVQIRTLLQHAYAELGHDRIYKGDAVVPPSVHRIVARSMALMETTDHLFCEAVEELERINKDLSSWCNWLDKSYRSVGASALESQDDEDATTIIETFFDLLKFADTNAVSNFFHNSAIECVKSRPRVDDLFSRPVVILVYWLVLNHPTETKARWPLPKFRDDLEMVAADLGVSFN